MKPRATLSGTRPWVALVLWLLVGPSIARSSLATAADPRGHAAWWLERHGPAQLPVAAQQELEGVYKRVAAATGRRSPGALHVIAGPATPTAAALASGDVILNEAMLKLCEKFGAEGRLDLIAFTIAHELSHLLTDDVRGFAAFASEPSLLRANSDEQKRTELAADARGLVLAVRAGFDHRSVLSAAGQGFFLHLEKDDKQRARLRRDALPNELETIGAKVEEYRFGVRLIELGRLEDGRLLLREFLRVFESREVLNDLAVANLRLAARELGRCDGRLLARFRLPTVIDGSTLAGRVRLRGAQRSPCYDNRRVAELVDEAIALLEDASRRDAEYLPARLNLIHARLLAGRFAEAVGPAGQAVELAPTSVEAIVANAVALHAFGQEMKLDDTSDPALDLLARADALRPSALAAWNRAAIEAERGRQSAARASWQRALELEPNGEWADLARERLGLEPPPAPPALAAHASSLAPPIPLGPKPKTTSLDSRELRVGTLRGNVLSGPKGVRALVIRDVVEIVESPPPAGWSLAHLSARLGAPMRIEDTSQGTLHFWPGLLAEVVGGELVALIWSTPSSAGAGT